MIQDRWRTLQGLWTLRRERAREHAVERLQPAEELDLVRRLERRGMAVELDLDVPNWRVDDIVRSRTTIAPTQTIAIPAQGPDFPQESHGWPQFSARVLANVVLDVDSALVFAADRVIAQSGTGTRAARDAAFVSGATIRNRRQRPIPVSGPIAPLGDVHHHYHFMVETLPRMLHARAVHPDVRFVTSATVAERYRTFLAGLGLIIESHPSSTVLASDQLVLVDQPELFWPRPVDIEVLRTTFAPPHRDARPTGQAVYISRRASARSLVDEAELEAHLVQRGFRSVRLEELSIRDQIELFASARVVVAPHGAGLAGIPFLPDGAQVLEITSGELFENCYRRMAACMDVDYRLVRIPADVEAAFGRGRDAAVIVDSLL